VLKGGGQFLIWDVSVSRPTEEVEDIYVVPVLVRVGEREVETGYGQPWPKETHDLPFYRDLAERTGFRVVEQTEEGVVFFLRLRKL
jgi:hypothetical protein